MHHVPKIRKSFMMAAAILSMGFAQAGASVIQLTFEGLRNQETVDNYYNGGFGGSGSGPGPADGIVFSHNSLSLISDQAGGNGNFDRTAPPSPSTGLFFLSGGADTMDVAAGFTTGFSFYYAAINQPGVVRVFSGLDGTGTLLATLNLPVTTAIPAGRFQPFVPIGVSFTGTAQSVDFGGTANQIVFDNITLGNADPTGATATPEPATVVAGLLGAAAVVVGRKLRRRTA